MDEFEDISHLNPENARTVEYREPARTVTYRNATVDGRWTRVRVDGRNFEGAAGRAAARSVGRRMSDVVTVAPAGSRAGVACYVVTVATGPRTADRLLPIVNVAVNVDTENA